MQQEGDTGGAAGQEAGAGKHIEAECCHEAAGEDALHVLDRRVARCAGVPETKGIDKAHVAISEGRKDMRPGRPERR